jgi:two-component system, chemotaxis family, chemotaxis protein CheY
MDAQTTTIEQRLTGPFRDEIEAQATRRLRQAPKCTVLVIDDDEGIRTAMAEILEALGYDVTVAADGQEAVDMLRVGLEPHAIVLDMMMPRMDGWTFLSEIRSDPRFREVPVVVASAVVRECPLGADGWLQKPFDLADLDREVARFCAH